MAALAVRLRRGRSRSRRGGSATPTRVGLLSASGHRKGEPQRMRTTCPPGSVITWWWQHTQQQWPASLLQCCRGVRLAPFAGWTPAPTGTEAMGRGRPPPLTCMLCYAAAASPRRPHCGVVWTVDSAISQRPRPRLRTRVAAFVPSRRGGGVSRHPPSHPRAHS